MQGSRDARALLQDTNRDQQCESNDDFGDGDDLHPHVILHAEQSVHPAGHPADPRFRMDELVDAEVQKDEYESGKQDPAGDSDAVHTAILPSTSPES